MYYKNNMQNTMTTPESTSVKWRSGCQECHGDWSFTDGLVDRDCGRCLAALTFRQSFMADGMVVDGTTRTGKPCYRCNKTLTGFVELPFCSACLTPN